MTNILRSSSAWLCLVVSLVIGCSRKNEDVQPPDHPRLTPNVTMVDVRFFSQSLQREIPYRVVLPANFMTGKTKLPVIYLLHGGGGGFRDWTNYSDVARYAEQGLILVMPEGQSSYYVNSVTHPQDRYEDYIVKDLIADVEQRFHVAAKAREQRAIAGVSMGGYGAITLALKHPDLFIFAAGLSSALDVPTRPFSIKRISQWRGHRAIFGPWNGSVQHQNDPYVLARTVDPGKMPFLFLACGQQEGLLPANRKFVSILTQRGFRYEFHAGSGNHDWNQWNARLPVLFDALLKRLNPAI